MWFQSFVHPLLVGRCTGTFREMKSCICISKGLVPSASMFGSGFWTNMALIPIVRTTVELQRLQAVLSR